MFPVSAAALTRTETIRLVVRLAIVSAVTYFSVKWMVNALDPTRERKLKAKEKAQEIMKKLGIKENIKLSQYEMMIASHLMEPASIGVSWDNIAGLEEVIQELRETVIFPLKKRELFVNSQLTQPPKGILLHGPPGCGKTMIAKAIAREAGANFINLDIATLTDKWYGESQKLAAAVFTLAMKIQPCIIFVDEIDSLLRIRDSHDHEATAMIKTQFMSMWDGLCTDQNCMVVVMGATNRPQDVDKAILRRMPATFHIGMPNIHQRCQILRLILQSEPIADDVDFNRLSKLTEGFCGSDLHELCRTASVYRLRDYMKTEGSKQSTREATLCAECEDEEEFHDALRPITMEDLLTSHNKMKESKVHCGLLPLFRLDLE